METQTADKITQGADLGFNLAPPEAVEAPKPVVPVAAEKIQQAGKAVQLDPEMTRKVDSKLEEFVGKLLTGDPSSEAFRAQIDASFALGRKEISAATELSNGFTKKNFVGQENEASYKAITEMRELFETLKPPPHAELFSPTKILGIPVPFGVGSKLARYLRRYQSAETQIDAITERMAEMSDDVRKDVAELAETRKQVWGAIQKLEAASQFMGKLGVRLVDEVKTLQSSDPMRAKAIEQEVLYYVSQNHGDILAAQALSINAYNVMEALQKTGRETIIGIDRSMTLGRAALSIAVTLAQATGNQIRAQKAINESKATIENLIASTSTALGSHVEMTTKFAADPVVGVKTLTDMFENTFKALDALDTYRSNALATMSANNQMLREQSKKAMDRIESRQGKVESKDAAPFQLDL